MSALTSHIMEVVEPENYLYNTLLQRCNDIPKFECICLQLLIIPYRFWTSRYLLSSQRNERRTSQFTY